MLPTSSTRYRRHFPCGSVDWNWQAAPPFCTVRRHFPCGSVDWNPFCRTVSDTTVGHFPCGSVDWNIHVFASSTEHRPSLPLRKCGLKSRLKSFSKPWSVTSLAEVWIEINSKNETVTDAKSLPLRKCGLKYCVTFLPMCYYRHFPCGSVDWNDGVALV